MGAEGVDEEGVEGAEGVAGAGPACLGVDDDVVVDMMQL